MVDLEELSPASAREPVPLKITRPSYPQRAFTDKLQGTVVVLVVIDERGSVAHAELRESIPGLDKAALACVRDWKFKPAQVEGRPVPTSATAPVTFMIY